MPFTDIVPQLTDRDLDNGKAGYRVRSVIVGCFDYDRVSRDGRWTADPTEA